METNNDLQNQRIISVEIDKEMKKSYIDYAMSVIVGRALPDVRDGLKPVHRRILYTMHESGLTPDKAYRKCATTVGDVLGKYHPHGDAAVYDSLVRMAQDFSLRYPLVDGHGNFGSVDGDPPAAYRYTESRMARLALEMLSDIEKDTVDFTPNYDDRLKEPTVLPSRFPNLLVNGSSGIAVGMATNIPPHNLTEIINGVIAIIDDPEITVDELCDYIKGPDFPTAGLIMGQSGIRSAYSTGRGRVTMRAKARIEPLAETRQQIIVTEIPYQVNKAKLIERIADLVKDKRIEGISDLRDESDRDGMRIVIELKRDANASVVLNNLYKYTQMQDTFSINMLALVDNQPRVLNLRQALDYYIAHQKEVIIRRTRFDLKKAEERAHILEGLKIAIDNIDEVIEIIKASPNVSEAKLKLTERFGLTDVQAQAIVDMRLGRLTGLERDKIENEYSQVCQTIEYLKGILASEAKVYEIIKEELIQIRDKFGDERRTEIVPWAEEDIDIEDLIKEEDNVITMTHFGYIKRLPVDTYKTQRRGGRGVVGLSTREEDFVETLFIASTHSHILFFTNKGRMYKIKAYHIPEAGRHAKGTAIVNLIPVEADEHVTAMIPVRQFEPGKFLIFATKRGIVKRTDLMSYNTSRKGGINAIVLDDDDELIKVKLTDGDQHIILGTYRGMVIRFAEDQIRMTGRVSRGVRGINLQDNDHVVGMAITRDGEDLLAVTEHGYGKKTNLAEYRVQSRGGKGLNNYRISDVTGSIAGIKVVTEKDDIMLITNEGVVIRIETSDISRIGRLTKGVRLMRLDDGVTVVGIARKEHDDEDDEEAEKVKPLNVVDENDGSEDITDDEGDDEEIIDDINDDDLEEDGNEDDQDGIDG